MQATVDRRAARVLLIAGRSVLLIRGVDPARPDRGTWWHTPGGGIEDGETIENAAVREVLEETGHVMSLEDIGPVVATRTAFFEFEDVQYRQQEWFFAVRVPAFDPGSDRWDEIERRSLLEHRWWTLDDLTSTAEPVYPAELAMVFRAVLDDTVEEPFELSGR